MRGLLVLGAVLAFLSTFAVWADRQLLDADNWADTSSELLESDAIRTQVSAFLVDELYANADVEAVVADALPPRLDPLAGPAANGLRTVAERTADRALDRPRFQAAWENANRVAAQQFIDIAEGDSRAVTVSGGAVVLDVRTMLIDLTQRLGLPGKVVGKIPPDAGQIRIMSADQVSTAQDAVTTLRGLAWLLPALMVAAFGLAVTLAEGRRRQTLLSAGLLLVLAGAVVLIARVVAGNELVDALVQTASVRPAAEDAWSIGTHMLRDVAHATIIIGIPLVVAAWLAGPTAVAVSLRRAMAPTLRDRPGVAYGAAIVAVLVVIAWGPIPATRMVAPILLMFGLALLGMAALRRQTEVEFPDARAGAAGTTLQEQAGRAWHALAQLRGSREGPAPTPGDGAPAPQGDVAVPGRPPGAARVDQLERLAALHATGALTDDEFAAQKTLVLGDGAPR